MILDTAYISAIGDRSSNQDALTQASEDELSCFVVADGTGGHAGGEVAADLVTQAIVEKFLQEASFSAHALRSYLDWAAIKVEQHQQLTAKHADMSATVACLLIDQSNCCALWTHLGDTRIYLFRLGKIIHVSKDHSMAQRLVDAGYAKYEELRQHPQRNQLYAAIGAQGDSFPDLTPEPFAVQDGDAFLLCSDGFWEWVSDDEMGQSLRQASSSDAWLANMNKIAEQNIARTNSRRDNFSAFAICLHAPTVAS
ncbi:PP2C family protein-serine/threonine phosphatase [Undibacterium sp. Ren11W]|uniref:PP2C family protein-serine/threonine phosphatase n=1 Tax=Undibacterium sp. Ren11W TaxID=3413045 RepID=UPI003BF1D8E9